MEVEVRSALDQKEGAVRESRVYTVKPRYKDVLGSQQN